MLYLETDRLILRDCTKSDFPAYCRLKMDTQTMYFLPDLQIRSPEEGRASFDAILTGARAAHRQFYFFLMEQKNTRVQIGSIGCTVASETPLGSLVRLGCFTYPDFRRQGYPSGALHAVLAFAFGQNNVYQVTTGCLAENRGSERVMQKNGLIREAEHIDYEWHDGRMKTRLEYRLLRPEWVTLPPK